MPVQLGQPVVFRPGTAFEERWGPGQYLSGMVTSIDGAEASLIVWPAGEYPPYYEIRCARDDALSKPRTWTPSVNDNTQLPEAPTDGQIYGRRNQSWTPVSGTGQGSIVAVIISDTQPSQPLPGMAWLDTTINNFFIYFQSKWVEPGHVNPTQDMVNVIPPLISGTVAVDSTLFCTTGDWSSSPITYSYQWYRGGIAISAAVQSSYKLVLADVNTDIHCKVTAMNSSGQWAVTPSNVIGIKTPNNVTLPVVSGAVVVGGLLVVSDGTWGGPGPQAFTYSWRKNGAPNGGTSNSYVIGAGDVGFTLTCVVTASNLIGSTPATSNGITIAVPSNTALPVVSGNLFVGEVLACSTGTWNNIPTSYSYQWKRGAANIAGATSSSYVLVVGDVSQSITCVVTATNALGNASATSNAVVPVLPANTVQPVMSYSVGPQGYVFSTYLCSTGTWSAPQPSLTYQWKRDGVAISGATSNSYNIAAADEGHTVLCTVTGTNSNGATGANSNSVAFLAYSKFNPATTQNATLATFTLTNDRVLHSNTLSGGAKALTLKSTGKFLVSMDFTIIRGTNSGAGFLMDVGTIDNMVAGTNCMRVMQNLGQIWSLNANTGKSLGGLVDGDDLHFAIDLDAHLIWIRRNNNLWNGDAAANPTTGAGGVVFGAGAYQPAIVFGGTSSSAAEIITCNFGSTGPAITLAGFTNGWPL